MTSARGPNLSNSLPVTGEIRPLSKPPGSRTSPAVNVVIKNTPCMRNGNSSIVENIVIMAMISISVVNVNMGNLNTRRSSIGSFDFNCLMTNNSRETPPTINGTYTFVLAHVVSALPALLKPKTIPPNPSVDSRIDSTSTLGLVMVVTFFRKMNETTIDKAAKGSTRKNNQRQSATCKIKPESVGPIAGANIITSPIVPIAAPRVSGG
ncbi:hypothetical protein D3C77_428960 [compost metagenome]